jgi:type II secretion system protein N
MTLYFIFLTFPFEHVKDQLLPQISKYLPFSLDIKEIRATPLLGLKASDVDLYSSKEDQPQKDSQPIVTIQKMKVRPSLLSFLFGKQALYLHGWLYGGEIQGKVAKRGSSINLVIEWKNIVLGKYEYAIEKMKVGGTFSGDVALLIQNRNPAQSEGSMQFAISEGSIKNFQMYSFSIPDLQDVTGTGRIKVGNRKATLEEFSFGSNEISVSFTGDVDLSPSLLQSRMNLKGSVNLSGKSASQYEPFLQGILRNKNKDGSYPFSLRGTFTQPRFGV